MDELSFAARAHMSGSALSAWAEILHYEAEDDYDPAVDTGYRELARMVDNEIATELLL